MSWATHYIEKLKAGETVQFRPRGNSMRGKIESGELVTVEPLSDRQLRKDDIVLCKVNGTHYLHLVKAIQGERYQIGNNIGRINGWVTRIQFLVFVLRYRSEIDRWVILIQLTLLSI